MPSWGFLQEGSSSIMLHVGKTDEFVDFHAWLQDFVSFVRMTETLIGTWLGP